MRKIKLFLNLSIIIFSCFNGIFCKLPEIFYKPQPIWSDKLNLDQIEERLQNEKVVEIIPLKVFFENYYKEKNINLKLNSFSHNSDSRAIYVVALESGLKAITKIRNELNYSERAAYNANKFFSFKLIPPTVIRKINNHQASLQFFVDSNLSDNQVKKYLKKVNKKDISDAKILLFVFGQSDTYIRNRKIQINGKKINLALIDNERFYTLQQARYPEQAYVNFGNMDFTNDDYSNDTSFPFDHVKKLTNPNMEYLKKKIGQYTPNIKSISHFIRKFRYIKYCIWQNTFWMQERADNEVNSTKIYYKSTLEKLKKLDLKALKTIWSEALENVSQEEKKYIYKLIYNTLDRKNQILKAAKLNGKIINDL